MTRRTVLTLLAGLGIGLVATVGARWSRVDVDWSRLVSPGPLSSSHAAFATNCTTCHTRFEGVTAAKCVGCHADNGELLQRQPTAFHASIGACSECHVEHQGARGRPDMNHVTLARIGLAAVERAPDTPTNRRLIAWLRQHEAVPDARATHPRVTTAEAALDCANCHSTKDPHRGYFGGDCATCHATTTWLIEGFQHPSARSVECVQCHQPPPSHAMMHFTMVSRSVTRQPDARVDQCFLCHQTTAWNDIRHVGWYQHH